MDLMLEASLGGGERWVGWMDGWWSEGETRCEAVMPKEGNA